MKYKIGDICLVNKRSYSTKDDYKFVNYLDTGNITKNSISQIQYIDLSSTKLPSRAKRIVQQNDIIYSTVRPNQEHYGFVKDTPNNFLVSTGFTVLTPDQEKVEPYWLYCYLTQKTVTNQMQTIAEQNVSTYPSIRPENLAEIELDLPDLETQKKIVRILSALDQKIELNNQQNEKLMETALSFYRDLLNKQDKDWGLGYVDDGKMTKITKSGISEYSGTKKYVATADVSGTNIIHFEKVKYNEKPSRANMTPKEDTVWFAKMEGSIKNILVADYSTDLINNYVFSTGFMGIECLNNFTYFMWCYINDDKFYDVKNSLSTGTLMAGISNSTIKNAKYSIPPQNLLYEFNNKVKPVFKMIYTNNLQNGTLSMMRDTLLPKLMSGEINIGKVVA